MDFIVKFVFLYVGVVLFGFSGIFILNYKIFDVFVKDCVIVIFIGIECKKILLIWRWCL